MSAAIAASAAAELYAAALAATTNTETEAQRAALKAKITDLVAYPCKISCQLAPEEVRDSSMNWVEIYVLSERRARVTDYLEIQPSGAIGVIFDLYDNPEKPSVGELSDRCDSYNTGVGVEFEEHDDDVDVDDDGEESE